MHKDTLDHTIKVVEAAERVRVARMMAAWQQDDESAKELADALEAFAKVKEAR